MSSDYFNYNENLAFPPRNEPTENERKLNAAREGILNAVQYLACPDDLSDINNGKCNAQMALES